MFQLNFPTKGNLAANNEMDRISRTSQAAY